MIRRHLITYFKDIKLKKNTHVIFENEYLKKLYTDYQLRNYKCSSIESLNQVFINNGYEISFINSCGRLINTATPNNISEIRKSWKDKHLNTKFGVGENSIRSILKRTVKIILNKVRLKKHLHFFNEFVLKNGLCDDEFIYGGNRHSIRVIIKKKST